MKLLLAFGTACAVVAGIAIDSGSNVMASDSAAPPGTPEFYSKRVKDILQNNCLDCHGEKAKGGLRLDSYSGIRLGGDDGAVIVPGDPEGSMLIQAIRRTGDLKMPPKSSLSAAEVSDLEAWVKAGAVGADAVPSTAQMPVTAEAHSAASPSAAGTPSPSASLKTVAAVADPDFFESKVRPIFANNCYECHSDSASGGLRLDSKAALEKGGRDGQVIMPGDPDKSLLIQAIKQTGMLKMPKGGKLRDDEVATLVAWVQEGAPWPAVSTAATTSVTAKSGAITEKQREFWSFQPLKTSSHLDQKSYLRSDRVAPDAAGSGRISQ